MRTATTLAKTGAGWVLLAGPDIPADHQRKAFGNIGDNWPKDATEVRFQINDGTAKIAIKDKSQNIARQVRDAEKRVAEKAQRAKEREAEEAAKVKAEAEKKAKADAAQRAAEVKAKEASKKSAK